MNGTFDFFFVIKKIIPFARFVCYLSVYIDSIFCLCSLDIIYDGYGCLVCSIGERMSLKTATPFILRASAPHL